MRGSITALGHIKVVGYNNGVVHFGHRYPGKTIVSTVGCNRVARDGIDILRADCGATVHYGFADQPEVIAIPVGAFADPTFPAPKYSVYEERRHAWVTLAGDIEHLD